MTFLAIKKACPRTWAEAWLLVRVLGLVAMLRVLLPYVQLPELLTWLAPRRIPAATRPALLLRAAYYTDGLLRRFHFPLPGHCLPRSLVLFYLATRFGYPVTFSCGVQRDGAALKGHAWLSRNGAAFLEEGDPEKRFAITFSFPEAKGL